jgi:hypothetical protein
MPQVLEMYNEEVMCIYDNYFKCVASDCADKLGDDDTLPLSGVRIKTGGNLRPSTGGNPFKIVVFLISNISIEFVRESAGPIDSFVNCIIGTTCWGEFLH